MIATPAPKASPDMSDLFDAIRASYDAEVRDHRPPVTAEDLPLSYEEISDVWLTNVLCRDHPGAAVIAHELGPVNEGNTSRRKIHLTYNDAGRAAGLPASVFCKSTARLASRFSLGICGGAEAEVDFYTLVRPHLDIEAPMAFWAYADRDTHNSIIMLEDLGAGAEFCTLSTDMHEGRVREQMSLLGRYHGRFFQSADADAVLGCLTTWPDYFRKVDQLDIEPLCAAGFDAARDVIPAGLQARFAKLWPATLASVERHKDLPHTLLHADVHLRNWYVSAEGRMGLADWQNACRGHWGRDLSYTIATAMSVEQRRQLERPMLAHYLADLHAAGGPMIPFDEAWICYRQQLPSALAWWTLTLTPSADMPDMQPRDLSLEMIRRISHAIDDAQSLDSFG